MIVSVTPFFHLSLFLIARNSNPSGGSLSLSLALPFPSFSDPVSVHGGTLRDSKFLSVAGRLKLGSGLHTSTQNKEQHEHDVHESTWMPVCNCCTSHFETFAAVRASSPLRGLVCNKFPQFSSKITNEFTPKVLDGVEVSALQVSRVLS